MTLKEDKMGKRGKKFKEKHVGGVGIERRGDTKSTTEQTTIKRG